MLLNLFSLYVYLFISFVYLSTIMAVFLFLICKRELNFLKRFLQGMFTMCKRGGGEEGSIGKCVVSMWPQLPRISGKGFLFKLLDHDKTQLWIKETTLSFIFSNVYLQIFHQEKSMVYMSNLCSRVGRFGQNVFYFIQSPINTSRSGRFPILQGGCWSSDR